jgi:hypothetical protein
LSSMVKVGSSRPWAKSTMPYLLPGAMGFPSEKMAVKNSFIWLLQIQAWRSQRAKTGRITRLVRKT